MKFQSIYKIFIQENAFENVVQKMAVILSHRQGVIMEYTTLLGMSDIIDSEAKADPNDC